MNKEEMLQRFQECLRTVSEFPDMASIEMTRYDDSWRITFRVWPAQSDSNHSHKVIASCTHLIGELKRDEDLGWFRGSKDQLDVDVVVNKPCKIIGYKTEKRAVTKTIETGDFVETRVPVTDCDLRKGKVLPGEYVVASEGDLK